MFANLDHYGGDVVMISVTPPGADRLPWDEEHCSVRDESGAIVRSRHPRGGRHDGKRGCRVEQRAAREWAETASVRYQGLRRAASVHVRRHAPVPVTLLERVWEPQKRGVPHLHLIVGVATPAELHAAAEFVTKLKELAVEYDFGFVDARGRGQTKNGKPVVVRGQVLKVIAPREAARYLSSYLTGRSKYKPSIRETVADPAMSALTGKDRRLSLPLIWLTPNLTSIKRGGTGITMRTLRRAGHLWAWSKGFCEDAPKWRDAVEAVCAGAAYRLCYRRQGAEDEPPALQPAELAAALALARTTQERFELLPPGYWMVHQRAEFERFMNGLALTLAGIKPEVGPLEATAIAEAA